MNIQPTKVFDTGVKFTDNPNHSIKAHLWVGDYTFGEVKELINEFQEANKHRDARMLNNVHIPIGWRQGNWTPLSTPASFYVPFDSAKYENVQPVDDNTKVDKFIIFIEKGYQAGGCNGKWNNCLWDCLNEALGGLTTWKYKGGLKNYLGLKKNEPIHIKHMAKVEKKIYKLHRTGISVSGDATYNSQVENPTRVIKLLLLHGHYSVVKHNGTFDYLKAQGLINPKKTFISYMSHGEKCYYYDGKRYWEDDWTQKNQHYKKRNQSSNCLISSRSTKDKGETDQAYLKRIRKQYKSDRKEILKLTDNWLDIAEHGDDIKVTEYLWQHFLDGNLTCLKEKEGIGAEEARWLRVRGGLIHGFKGTYDNAYHYDVVGSYLSHQMSTNFTFPIKKGEFKTISDFAEINKGYPNFPYGLYRVKVQEDKDPYNYRCVKTNDENIYTHTDLGIFKEVGYEFELIQDGKPNCLLYSNKARVNARTIFRPFINFLTQLQQRATPKCAKRIKIYSRALWGYLSRRAYGKKTYSIEAGIEIGTAQRIAGLQAMEDARLMTVEIEDMNKVFKFDWARMGVFLTARAREKLARVLIDHPKEIVSCHTDGVYSTKPLDLDVGSKLGDWKMKKVKVLVKDRCHAEVLETYT